MAPRILIVVDESPTAKRAVKHVANIARAAREMDVTLLHVVGVPPELLEHEGSEDPAEEQALEVRVAAREAAFRQEVERCVGPKVFGPALAELQGIEGLTVHTKIATAAHTQIAPVVVGELARHHYEAVAVGREHRSKLRELVNGSVAQDLLHDVEHCAVWVVD